MEKVFLKFTYFVLLFMLIALNLSAQTQTADVINEVLVEDLAGSSKVLQFGLDTTATDGIDIHLGESDLPPFPPAGAFEARFFLPENNFQGTLGSYLDFRQAFLPSFDSVEYRLAYQVGTGTVIKITWDFPSDVTGLLQDIIIGTIINQPMADSGSYTVDNPGAINRLRMMIYYSGTVPVELSSFTANVVNKMVELRWVTATEMNNAGFEVERRQKSEVRSQESDWERIGFIEGRGTTSEESLYSFVDNKIEGYRGTIKYRLKQIDFDGTFEYSNEIEVEVDFSPEEFVLMQNYPNPFNPETVISWRLAVSSQVTLKIFNVIGEEVATLVNEILDAGLHSVNFNAEGLNSGVYFYKIDVNEKKLTDGGIYRGGNYTATRKMVVIK